MRKQSSMFLSICLGLALAGTSQAQPAPRILNVVPDGRELLIPLTAADIGRDIILVGESTAKNESQIEVSLGGAAGVLGQVLASTVSPSTQVAAMNLYSGWNIVKVRYQNSDFKTAILVGESTSSGGSADCFETMDPVTQVFVRQLYPGK